VRVEGVCLGRGDRVERLVVVEVDVVVCIKARRKEGGCEEELGRKQSEGD